MPDPWETGDEIIRRYAVEQWPDVPEEEAIARFEREYERRNLLEEIAEPEFSKDLELAAMRDGLRDPLDYAAYGTSKVVSWLTVPLALVAIVTTAVGGLLGLITAGLSDRLVRAVVNVLTGALLAGSRAWYSHRLTRLVLLIPGVILVSIAQVIFALVPSAALSGSSSWSESRQTKRQLLQRADAWPLTSLIETYRTRATEAVQSRLAELAEADAR